MAYGKGYSGAKTKSNNTSYRSSSRKSSGSHRATSVPQAGKRKIAGAKVKTGYAC